MAHVASWQNARVTARGLVTRTAFAALALSQFAAIPQTLASEVSFADFPFLVNCELNGVLHAYYLSRIGSDGVAVYITPDRQAGTITASGKAEPVGGDWSGSCSGKTLEQLRSAGQAYYFQP